MICFFRNLTIVGFPTDIEFLLMVQSYTPPYKPHYSFVKLQGNIEVGKPLPIADLNNLLTVKSIGFFDIEGPTKLLLETPDNLTKIELTMINSANEKNRLKKLFKIN